MMDADGNEISGISEIFEDADDKVEVYSLSGLKLNIASRADLENLAPGIYIINGVKTLVK